MTAPLPTLRGHKHPNKTTMPMIARMKALASAGLSARAIAAVIELDYGVSLHEATVRKHIGPMAHCSAPAQLTRLGNGANWHGATGGRS